MSGITTYRYFYFAFFIFATLCPSWSTPTPLPVVQRGIVQQNETIVVELPGLPPDVVPLTMVYIPPGTFLMGEPGNTDTNVQRLVTLTKGFYISKYEITQAQWAAVMGEGRRTMQGGNIPVDQPYWDEFNLFISKLNELGKGYFRFPTEAEWEYACRAGTTTRFYWGDDASIAEEYGWFRTDSNEVGLKFPNPWGLYDMNGNVTEICQDYFHPTQSSTPVTDPVNLVSNQYQQRVFRGEDRWMEPQGSHFRTTLPYSIFLVRRVGLRPVMVPEAPIGTPTPTFTPAFTPTNTRTPTPTSTPIPTFIPANQEFRLPSDFIDGYGLLSYVDIDPIQNTVSERREVNIRAGLHDASMRFNARGDVLFRAGIVVRIHEDGLEIVQVPDQSDDFLDWMIDSEGNHVAYQLNGRIKIFDVERKVVTNDFPAVPFRRLVFSKNLETILYSHSAEGLGALGYVVEKKDGEYAAPIFLSSQIQVSYSTGLYVSNDGKRVFFDRSVEGDVYFQRVESGWEMVHIDLNASILGLANNGHTLLVDTGISGYGLVHQVDGGWSKPELIGTLTSEFLSSSQLSEDAKVLVTLTRGYQNNEGNELYIYIKNQGKWSEHRIGDIGGIGLSYFDLTDSGNRVYWAPFLTQVSVGNWMLH